VATRFVAASGNASNAPFRVNGSLVTIDQKAAPNDLAFEYRGNWESLGTVTVTNGVIVVELSDAANGTVVADGMMVYRLRSIVVPPPPSVQLSVSDVTRAEGDSGNVAFTFVITRTGDPSDALTVQWKTIDGTATVGSDYIYASGILYFAPGQTEATVTVWVLGDTTVEDDETFFLEVNWWNGASNAFARGLGTIQNDDTRGGKKK
jgi:hypothetical protein